jgi:hypothetical protein
VHQGLVVGRIELKEAEQIGQPKTCGKPDTADSWDYANMRMVVLSVSIAALAEADDQ